MTVADWWGQRSHPGSKTAKAGAADTLNAFNKILQTIEKWPVGAQLIVFGILCIGIGSVLGGAQELVG